jgi:hypothetical protein
MEFRHHFPVLTQSRNVAFKSQCLVSRVYQDYGNSL